MKLSANSIHITHKLILIPSRFENTGHGLVEYICRDSQLIMFRCIEAVTRLRLNYLIYLICDIPTSGTCDVRNVRGWRNKNDGDFVLRAAWTSVEQLKNFKVTSRYLLTD